MKKNETEENLMLLAAKGWLKKGYLLYLYYSCATNMYEYKPIDPDFYSKIALESFRNKHSASHKLYDNIEEMLSDREELNSSFMC